MVHLMEACLLTALQAYLLGSLLFGVLVSKLFYHDDVRLHGPIRPTGANPNCRKAT